MKITTYIYFFLLLITLGACSQDDLPYLSSEGNSEEVKVEGDEITIRGSLFTPGIAEATTRAMGETADLRNLHLYLVEFVDNGNPLTNTFTRLYEAENETVDAAASTVSYKLTLKASATPRILHLIALPKGTTLDIEYGVEASVIPSLYTENGIDAYWRRISFPNGYCSVGEDGGVVPVDDLKSSLTEVALIRNFAKISVNNYADDFQFTGFHVINTPTRGAIAPYNATTQTFPDFIDSSSNPFPYLSIKEVYSGNVPAGTDLSNKVSGASYTIPDDPSPKYIYERNIADTEHTFIIIKGLRKGKEQYYKLDIGQSDNRGMFVFYSLLRNFNFCINIRSVNADGYASPLLAAQGSTFNNLSFDVELASLLNMSDGKEVVYVNFTTHVFTEPTAQNIEFKFKYKNLTGNGPSFNNSNVNFIDFVTGDVITGYSDKGDSSDGWRTIKIDVAPASDETKIQTFTIVKQSGLGRTINLILHRKWDLLNLKEFNKALDNWDTSTKNEGVGPQSAPKPMTVFFDLLPDLPKAIFPLEFYLESKNQDLEAYQGNTTDAADPMIVTSAPSLFATNDGKHPTTIQYKRTITWSDYNKDYASGGTKIVNEDNTVTHRVRCQFQTIVSMKNLYPTATSKVTRTDSIAVSNENYNIGKVKYTRSYTPS